MRALLKSCLEPGPLGRRLLKGAFSTTVMKLASMGLRFLTTICLTRALGVESYGVYAFVFTLMTVLSEPVFGGLRTLTLRNAAQLSAASAWGLLRGLRRRLQQIFLLSTLGVAAVILIIGHLRAGGPNSSGFVVYTIAAALPVMIGLMRFYEGFLLGLGHVTFAQTPKYLLRPGLTLFFLGPVVFLALALTPAQGLALYGLAVALSLMVYRLVDQRLVPAAVFRAAPTYRTRRWLAGSVPLMISAGFYMLEHQGAVLVMGTLASPRETGLFHAAMRLAEIVGLVHAAANIALQPVVARLHAAGERDKLQRVITLSALVVLTVTIVVSAVIFEWGGLLLRLFGEEFTAAHVALNLLVVGNILNVMLGSSGMILPMADRAGESAKGVILGAISNIGLSVLLVPEYGLIGAALAAPTAIVISKVYLVWRMRRVLGLDPTVFGLLLKPKAPPKS